MSLEKIYRNLPYKGIISIFYKLKKIPDKKFYKSYFVLYQEVWAIYSIINNVNKFLMNVKCYFIQIPDQLVMSLKTIEK